MPTLVLQPTSTAQWHALVNEACLAADCRLDETLESYLVFLLMRFIGRPEMAARVMAVDYLAGMHASGSLQHDRLREVGDHCLLFSGLFPKRAERRMVRISYFVDLGRSAYWQLASRQMHRDAEMYGRLSSAFVALMEVLQAMRALDGGASLETFDALELWQDTGSAGALKSLRSSTEGKVVPIRTPKRH